MKIIASTLLALLVLSLNSGQASATNYVSQWVSAENVVGVVLILSKEIVREDCNQHHIEIETVLVSGTGDGWGDKYFMDAYTPQTEIGCPPIKPVTETIYSEQVFIEAASGPNTAGKVNVTVVIPVGYQLIVEPIN